jgi:hypothetical protein
MVEFHNEANKALKVGVSLADIRAMPIITRLLKAKFDVADDQLEKLDELGNDVISHFRQLEEEREVKGIVG